MAKQANSGIYEIVNLANGKRYIGSAVSFRVRFATHLHGLRRGQHHSRFLQNSWLRHGEASFAFRKLIICRAEDLLFFEQLLIDAMKPEYNICQKAGSSLGVRWTEEARKRQSDIQKKNRSFLGRKHSAETLALMSAAQKGRASPMKGRIRKPEAVARTAAAHKGTKRSDETRSRISAARTGSKMPPRSAEARANLSAALKGKRKSPEHMAKLQAGRKSQVFTSERRAKVSGSLKMSYADGRRSKSRPPEYREKIASTLRQRAKSPEYRERMRHQALNAWRNKSEAERKAHMQLVRAGRGISKQN